LSADGDAASDNGFENGTADFVRSCTRLLRATFSILCKKQAQAMNDLNDILGDETAPADVRWVNTIFWENIPNCH
jgi:hypothetical protein